MNGAVHWPSSAGAAAARAAAAADGAVGFAVGIVHGTRPLSAAATRRMPRKSATVPARRVSITVSLNSGSAPAGGSSRTLPSSRVPITR